MVASAFVPHGVDSVSSLEASGGVAAGVQKPGSSLQTTKARKKRKKKKKPKTSKGGIDGGPGSALVGAIRSVLRRIEALRAVICAGKVSEEVFASMVTTLAVSILQIICEAMPIPEMGPAVMTLLGNHFRSAWLLDTDCDDAFWDLATILGAIDPGRLEAAMAFSGIDLPSQWPLGCDREMFIAMFEGRDIFG